LPTKTERSGEQTATPPPSTSGEQRRTDGAGDGSCGSNDHGTRPTAAFDADAAEQLRAIGFRGAEAFVRGNDLAADLVEQAIREARDDRTVHSAPAIVRTWLKDPERRDELRARAEEERRIREAAHRRQEEDERHRQALLEKHRREKAAWEAYEAEDPDGAALVRITGDRSLARIGDADVRKWALSHVLSHEHPCDRVAALRQALEDGTAPAAVREWVTGKPAATQAPERLKMQRQPSFGLEPHDVQRMYRTYPHELLMSVFPVIDADPNPAGTAKAWFARDEGCELSEEELVEEVARRAKLNGVPFGRAGGPAG